MIKARHHFFIYPLFKLTASILIKQHFNSVTIDSDFIDRDCSVLVISNHTSWLDGFWIEHLNRNILHRRFYFMMLHNQLEKRWYFKHTGGYPVKKNTRQVIQSIQFTTTLLQNQENMVLMFPQGIIHSSYSSHFHFEHGIDHIINQSKSEFQIMFTACLTDYFSNSRPNLFIYTKTVSSEYLKNRSAEKEYTDFYNLTLSQHREKVS